MSAEREGLTREARLWLSQMAKRYADEGQMTNGPRALAVKDYDFKRGCAWVERLLALLDSEPEPLEPGARCFECHLSIDLKSNDWCEVNHGLALVCSRKCWEAFAKRYDEDAEPEPDARYVVVATVVLDEDGFIADFDHEAFPEALRAPEGDMVSVDVYARVGPVPRVEPVVMALCEQNHIMLRPNVLYRFEPVEGCERCAEIVATYAGHDAGRAPESEEGGDED